MKNTESRYILTSTVSSDEHYDGDCDCCLIPMGAESAKYLLTRMDRIRQMHDQDNSVHEIRCWDAQRQIGHEFLEPGVLQFEFLESLGLGRLHAAVLLAPAVERSLANLQSLADLRDRRPAGQYRVGLTQLADDLFRAVPFPLHLSLLPGSPGP